MKTRGKHRLLRHLPRVALGSFSLLAALYLGLSPRFAPRVYARRLFKPYRYPEGSWDVLEIEGVPRQDCYFRTADGSILHAWYFENIKAKQTIIFSHGNTGNLTGRLNMVRLLLRAGASVFIYDYRGYGRSKGAPSIHGICQDGVAAFDYLRDRQNVPTDDIILYGESLGTAVTCEIAAERDAAGVILQSGFSSLKKIGEEQMPLIKLYPRFLFPRPILDAAARMAERKGYPLLIIHGEKDQVVPFAHAQEVFAGASEPKHFVQLPDCAHSDIWCNSPEMFVESVRKFLQELV